MACDGFDHGSRVRPLKGFLHEGAYFTENMVGTIEQVDRLNHRIDVRFEGLGLIEGLPAHSFGLVATAG
jgi:hypothetical protein